MFDWKENKLIVGQIDWSACEPVIILLTILSSLDSPDPLFSFNENFAEKSKIL